MFIHVFFLFPETAGKTLEEAEAMFEDPQGIKYLGTPAWKTSKKTSYTVQMERGEIDAKPVEVQEHWEHKGAEGTREGAEDTIVTEKK